ncbi:MAG: hypothetical protein HS107_10650 [Thermoflexaceae bacterium]|nr:hypothetical protein [Thermoflexaceae bacterium]
MGSYRIGWIMAVWLIVLIFVDFSIAQWVDHDQLRFSLLTIGTLAEAIPIAYYFMHISRVWQGEVH